MIRLTCPNGCGKTIEVKDPAPASHPCPVTKKPTPLTETK